MMYLGATTQTIGLRAIGGLFILATVLWSTMASAQDEALCAEVKIEISQELTLERQGFEALMRITNSLDTFTLEDVSVTVNFTDANGDPVVATSNTSASDAAFFIRLDDSKDVSGLQTGADGAVSNGSIAPQDVGEMRWLIIPTANAAGQTENGQLFYVGAQLNYSYGGKEETVDVAPDFITVKPQPALTLDYFLTKNIIGDDAFTQEIEPAVPYTLGVRINNSGFGAANNVKIESAQPRIVENELGLAVGFNILGSTLEDQPTEPTLLMNFGAIASQDIKVGRWVMETNLSGKFTDFNASFTHADELGGELTSLLQGTNAHFLEHDVQVDLPGRDSIRDFLAYDAEGALYVYESENTGADAMLCTDCVEVTSIAATIENTTITHSSQTGFSHAQVPDPYAGSRVLAQVIRSDGKILPAANHWLSQKRAADDRSFDYFINLFDSASTGEYTLVWGDDVVDIPQPPVIRLIQDRTTYEGNAIGFLVQASDPNETLPALTINALPTNASFTDNGDGSGVFQWTPLPGQAGNYTLTFAATDGQLTASRSVMITVNPADDTDGDGMNDAEELATFGNLDRDGTGDLDGDGRSDAQELAEGTDPNVVEVVPGQPLIVSPAYRAETLDGSSTLLPELVVTNGQHSDDIGAVVLIFEVYSDAAMTDRIARATVNEGEEKTRIQLTEAHLEEGKTFADDTAYFWRVRSQDANTPAHTSFWVTSEFFINTVNNAPATPILNSPDNNAFVAETSPSLSVIAGSDNDRDRLYYGFTVFSDEDLETPLAEVTGLSPNTDNRVTWRIPKVLEEDFGYLWRATVTDEHGAASTSEWRSLVVSTINNAPSAPTIFAPETGSTLTSASVTLAVTHGEDPENQPLSTQFEIDTVDTFNSAQLRSSDTFPQAGDLTEWTVENLPENTTYYWRARHGDGERVSEWVGADFMLAGSNQAPPTPTINNPVDNSIVNTPQPVFSVNPVQDPDNDSVNYHFEIYGDEALTDFIREATIATPEWPIEIELDSGFTYFWRVRAIDDNDQASAWSTIANFTVQDVATNTPPTFEFVLPSEELTVEGDTVTIQWADSDPDSSAIIQIVAIDAQGVETVLLENRGEDADGDADSFIWDITTVSAGTYRLQATIEDDDNRVVIDGCCDIVIPDTSGGTDDNLQSLFCINAGGDAIGDDQNPLLIDQHYVGGTAVFNNASFAPSTLPAAAFNSARSGNFGYNIPVPESGYYTVDLWYVITAEAPSPVADAFDVHVEDRKARSLFTLERYAAPFQPYRDRLATAVTDGILNITLTTQSGQATLSALCLHQGRDAASTDSDGDLVADAADDFPFDPNETRDSDSDGVGDNADAFPYDATETSDLDGDGIGDNRDSDRDGDGVDNNNDAFPDDASESRDLDGDGIGDNADSDRDGDGYNNTDDAFPDDATEWADENGNGIGDNEDNNGPGEPAPFDYVSDLPWLNETNGWGPAERNLSNGENAGGDGQVLTINGVTYEKGIGVHADSTLMIALDDQYKRFTADIGIDDEVTYGAVIFSVELDGGVIYTSEPITGADDATAIELDVTGGVTLTLTVDQYGSTAQDHANWADAKLYREVETLPDADGDGVPDDEDQFPNDPNESEDSDGDGIGDNADLDADNDGVEDAVDIFPQDPTEFEDSDNDGLGNNIDSDDQAASEFVSDMMWISEVNGWGAAERDRSNGEQGDFDGQGIILNGVAYKKGIGVHANSVIDILLAGEYSRFTADIGIDDEITGSGGAVKFQLELDGQVIYTSERLTADSETVSVDVNVVGGMELRLIVDSDGSVAQDHADWANAQLHR